jgi:hypothetical protein
MAPSVRRDHHPGNENDDSPSHPPSLLDLLACQWIVGLLPVKPRKQQGTIHFIKATKWVKSKSKLHVYIYIRTKYIVRH